MLMLVSVKRETERIEEPSQSMARIWARVLVSSLFTAHEYELLCLPSRINIVYMKTRHVALCDQNEGVDSMSDEAWLNPTKGPAGNEVAIDYVKSPDFRLVWADGLIGSMTPNGLLHFALYAERPAIPRRQVFSIDPVSDGVGQLGAEVLDKQISRGSIVRELSVDILVSAQVAEDIGKWLIKQAEELRKLSKEEAGNK